MLRNWVLWHTNFDIFKTYTFRDNLTPKVNALWKGLHLAPTSIYVWKNITTSILSTSRFSYDICGLISKCGVFPLSVVFYKFCHKRPTKLCVAPRCIRIINVVYIPLYLSNRILKYRNAHHRLRLSGFFIMTSSNGNNFRVTGLPCGEYTGHRWIPRTKASNAELWCFLWSAPEPTLE